MRFNSNPSDFSIQLSEAWVIELQGMTQHQIRNLMVDTAIKIAEMEETWSASIALNPLLED